MIDRKVTVAKANRALDALADFAWNELSDEIEAELTTHATPEFHHLSYHNSRPRCFNSEDSTRAAKSAYRTTVHEDFRKTMSLSRRPALLKSDVGIGKIISTKDGGCALVVDYGADKPSAIPCGYELRRRH
ncbi:hypothetical protein EDB19DRAFT_1825115 [Suillus lakei]|nr:hypothetical protein EDB19DRAFT_1825115 [Suillus lakei]